MSLTLPSLLSITDTTPVPNHTFMVNVGVAPFGVFTKVSGLGYEIDPFEIEEGGRNESVHFKPFSKPRKWTEVELSWGAVKKPLMEAWIQLVAPGYLFRRCVFITQFEHSGKPARFFVLMGAWPKKWTVGDLDSTGNDIATESLTLVCENVVTIPTELI